MTKNRKYLTDKELREFKDIELKTTGNNGFYDKIMGLRSDLEQNRKNKAIAVKNYNRSSNAFKKKYCDKKFDKNNKFNKPESFPAGPWRDFLIYKKSENEKINELAAELEKRKNQIDANYVKVCDGSLKDGKNLITCLDDIKTMRRAVDIIEEIVREIHIRNDSIDAARKKAQATDPDYLNKAATVKEDMATKKALTARIKEDESTLLETEKQFRETIENYKTSIIV